jgi:large subunit ribosomal protein L17
MRHNVSGKKFGKSSSHRKAMFRNMAKSLLTHERITTTEIKAKELRKFADRLITWALENDLHSRRLAYRVLESHTLVQKLFDEIGPRFSGMGGGYTRIVKLALPRRGDCAPMAVIELATDRGAKAGKPAQSAEQSPAASSKASKAE